MQHKKVDIRDHIDVHYVGDRRWMHTHGMDMFGLPDLEARGVPGWLVYQAARVMNNICDYLVHCGETVDEGDPFEIGDSIFTLRPVKPYKGLEDHYETPRWCIMDFELKCDECDVGPEKQINGREDVLWEFDLGDDDEEDENDGQSIF